MLTKVLSLLLITLLGLALGIEAARYVHAQAAGPDVGGAVIVGTSGVSGTTMVNIHRALLGISLLATSGALLLSLRGRSGLGVGAWLNRQWLRFTTWLELTLDGLFDFDALNMGNGGTHLMTLYKIAPRPPKLSLRASLRPPPSREGKQPDGSYVIEVGPNETAEDVVRRHPDVLRIHQGTGDILVKNRGTGGVIVRSSPPDEPSST